MLAPLLLAAVALGLRAVFECVRTFFSQQPFAYPFLFWWQIAAFIALPLAMLAGMLRAPAGSCRGSKSSKTAPSPAP